MTQICYYLYTETQIVNNANTEEIEHITTFQNDFQ